MIDLLFKENFVGVGKIIGRKEFDRLAVGRKKKQTLNQATLELSTLTQYL